MASGSRGAWLAASVGAAAYWLMSRRKPDASLKPSLGAALAAVVAAIAWSCRPNASVADIGRREVWRTALTAFAQRPLLGWARAASKTPSGCFARGASCTAMGSTHRQAYAHNDILQVLASMGIAGAAVYAALLVALAKAARRALEPSASRAFAAALAAGLIGLWANLEFNPVSLEVFAFAAVLAGMLVSLTAESPSVRLPRGPLLAAAALATLSLAFAVRIAGADANFKLAARGLQADRDFISAQPAYAQARKADPCELTYILGEVNASGDWINASHDVNERLSLLGLADEAGRTALMCHPRQVNAHYIAGGVAARACTRTWA